MAGRLTAKFGLIFSSAKVARKWKTLVDGYKGVKDNNNSTGRGVVWFKSNQMDSLLVLLYSVHLIIFLEHC